MQATDELDHAQEPTIAEQIESVQLEDAEQPMDAESDAANEQLALLQAIPELMEKVTTIYTLTIYTRVFLNASTTLLSLFSSLGNMKLTCSSFKHFARLIWLKNSKPRVRECTTFTRSPKVSFIATRKRS
jgi:hypothetical protein